MPNAQSDRSIDDLNQDFAKVEGIRIVDRGGYRVVQIRTDACEADIALHGAQVLHWRPRQLPPGQPDVLWCAPLPPRGSGKAIRGGVPICWPWFGPHAADPALPQHGLVRLHEWQLWATDCADAGAVVVLTCEVFGCAVRLDVHAGPTLTIRLCTRNVGDTPVTVTEALHTYFSVGDVGGVRVDGLDGCSYRDNANGGAVSTQRGPLRVHRETVALFDQAPDICTVDDEALDRVIRIERTGGQSTVVWHPGASVAAFKDIPPGTDRGFVCVESGNIGSSAVTVQPGAEHRLAVSYTVEMRSLRR